MSLLRWLGIGEGRESGSESDTATVRRIAERLERLPADEARRLAAFAYVLARVAHADLSIVEAESAAMEQIVRDTADLGDEEAALTVEIAKSQARLLGGTENYVVTRQFRELSDSGQRVKLLECLYAVAAADGQISAPESAEISAIAEELGFTRPENLALRARWRDQLSELQPRPGS